MSIYQKNVKNNYLQVFFMAYVLRMKWRIDATNNEK